MLHCTIFFVHFSILYRLITTDEPMYVRMQNVADGTTNDIVLTDINIYEYFNSINFPKRRVHFSREILVRISAIFLYEQESVVLRHEFNNKLSQLQQSGLIDNYQRIYRGIKHDTPTKEPKTLHVGQISPIFRICCILHTIALLVFLFELFADKYEILARFIEYLTY